MKSVFAGQKAYTFLELMVAVSVLSIGIVGIYKVLLSAMDYQTQLSCRLFAANLMEHEISLLENQIGSGQAISPGQNEKVVEVLLDRRNVAFVVRLLPAVVENNVPGFLPVTVVLSWPDRDRTMSLRRDVYLVNLRQQLANVAETNP